VYERLTEREVQELLYGLLIDVVRVDSAHAEDWSEGDCECGWHTSGAPKVVELAAYDHISEVHMLGWRDLVFAVGDRLRDALSVITYYAGNCDGGHECACDSVALNAADDLIEKHTLKEGS